MDKNYTDMAYNIFLVGIVFSLALSVAAWNWIFKGWYRFIYSWMPEDNQLIMALTSGVILLLCLFVIYFLPPLILAFIIKRNKKLIAFELPEFENRSGRKHKMMYSNGKRDGKNGNPPKYQQRSYLAGYREGVASSGKITLPELKFDHAKAGVYIDPHSDSKE